MAEEKTKQSNSPQNIVARRRFVRMTPDKVRLAAKYLEGKSATLALNTVNFLPLAAAKPLALTLKNALAMARDANLEEDDLKVRRIVVDEGPKLKRRRIIHQGKATAILKRMSHITVVLQSKTTQVRNQKIEIKRTKGASSGS